MQDELLSMQTRKISIVKMIDMRINIRKKIRDDSILGLGRQINAWNKSDWFSL